ncbi:MAG: hypothetical protein ACRDTJ_09275 [Pseudonocardiaceae bacterium]
MSDPKQFLPESWTDKALEKVAAWLLTPLVAADDAHDVIDEDEDED